MGITGAGCHGPGESGVLPPNNCFHLETCLRPALTTAPHQVFRLPQSVLTVIVLSLKMNTLCSTPPVILHPLTCPPVTPLSDHLTWTPRCFTRTNYPSLAKTSTCKVRQNLVTIPSHQDQDSALTPGFFSCQCSEITRPLSPGHRIIYLIISCLDKMTQ